MKKIRKVGGIHISAPVILFLVKTTFIRQITKRYFQMKNMAVILLHYIRINNDSDIVGQGPDPMISRTFVERYDILFDLDWVTGQPD
jgi:hypothetical protein